MKLEEIKAIERLISPDGKDDVLPKYVNALCLFRAQCLALMLQQRCRSFALTSGQLAQVAGVLPATTRRLLHGRKLGRLLTYAKLVHPFREQLRLSWQPFDGLERPALRPCFLNSGLSETEVRRRLCYFAGSVQEHLRG